MSKTDAHVLVVGAGLAGSLIACDLARMGYRVSVYERRPDPRAKGFVGGRSINLALSVRGITALQRVGLAERVLADAIPMRGRTMHAVDGTITRQPYSAHEGDAINSVSRGGLNMTLMDAAEKDHSVPIRFSMRCEHVDLESPGAVFVDDRTGVRETVEADVILGCDGAFSAVRSAMQRTDRFDYSQSYLKHGYKELLIPPASECGVDPGLHDGFALEPNALHIWPRGGSMMIALPNVDRTFTCTLFWPFEGEHSFARVPEDDPAAIRAFFEAHYGDAVPLMPTLVEDFSHNPTSSLVTVRCEPWFRANTSGTGGTALIGDAAHAIVPFFGQGMNAAFEDCRVLAEMLEAKPGDFSGVLAEYARVRKPHGDAIADMAITNFVEMRDRVADPVFLYKKRVEQALHAALPEDVHPLYNQVSFSNEPYAEALREGTKLSQLLDRVIERVPEQPFAEQDQGAWRDMLVEAYRAERKGTA